MMNADDACDAVATGDLFADAVADASKEVVTGLLSGRAVRIERIVSTGQVSPEGFWYDQDEHEWVMVAAGRARLEFENPRRTVDLRTGGWVHIPAHVRHRVAWTDPERETVWLAVFYRHDLST